jgi:hypothetical protein
MLSSRSDLSVGEGGSYIVEPQPGDDANPMQALVRLSQLLETQPWSDFDRIKRHGIRKLLIRTIRPVLSRQNPFHASAAAASMSLI